MSNPIENTSNVIDSRDIIERIEYLEDMDEIDTEEDRELAALKALAKEAEYCSDWQYGETLINEDYFVAYTEELIKDCYEMPKEIESGDWPWRHMTVDYEAAADELRQDYTEVDFDGTTFLIRA